MRAAVSAKSPRPGLTLHLAFHRFTRQFHLSPALAAALFGAGPLLLLGCFAIGGYFMFRDDMLASLMRRQAHMQFAYEDRIAALRAQVDALASRQMLNQDKFEGKVAQLAVRQAELESRSALLASLAARVDPDITSVAATGPAAPQAASVLTLAPKPSVANGGFKPVPEGLELRTTDGVAAGPGLSENDDPPSPDQRLKTLASRFDRVERRQIVMLNALEAPAAEKAERLREAFAEAGLSVERMIQHGESPAAEGVGGPFVPADLPGARGDFARAYASLSRTIDLMDGLRGALPFAPLRKPLPGAIEITSPFGYRVDPFLGRPALHTGMDLHGEYGEAVHATAAGRVTVAGATGGYGNMVEIDHGAGLSTRYGHLSRIDVAPGQWVTEGQDIGAIGSTGRSTGPHLHYEVRVDGAPVDPGRYLKAGQLLSASQ